MSIPAKLLSAVVGKADLMRHHDIDRIQGYCRDCGMYGKFWSCPPFDSQPLTALPEWTHAVLVMWQTPVHIPDDLNALIEQFQAARRQLGEILIDCEPQGSTAVIAGQCFGCSDCVRGRGRSLLFTDPDALFTGVARLRRQHHDRRVYRAPPGLGRRQDP